MSSYYNMGMAAEVRMHQLLHEAEHGRLIRGIEKRHDHRTTSVPLRARTVTALQRLVRRGQPASTHPAIEGC
jgi:hypothetical protein